MQPFSCLNQNKQPNGYLSSGFSRYLASSHPSTSETVGLVTLDCDILTDPDTDLWLVGYIAVAAGRVDPRAG
jgi:hypothetical protein